MPPKEEKSLSDGEIEKIKKANLAYLQKFKEVLGIDKYETPKTKEYMELIGGQGETYCDKPEKVLGLLGKVTVKIKDNVKGFVKDLEEISEKCLDLRRKNADSLGEKVLMRSMLVRYDRFAVYLDEALKSLGSYPVSREALLSSIKQQISKDPVLMRFDEKLSKWLEMYVKRGTDPLGSYVSWWGIKLKIIRHNAGIVYFEEQVTGAGGCELDLKNIEKGSVQKLGDEAVNKAESVFGEGATKNLSEKLEKKSGDPEEYKKVLDKAIMVVRDASEPLGEINEKGEKYAELRGKLKELYNQFELLGFDKKQHLRFLLDGVIKSDLSTIKQAIKVLSLAAGKGLEGNETILWLLKAEVKAHKELEQFEGPILSWLKETILKENANKADLETIIRYLNWWNEKGILQTLLTNAGILLSKEAEDIGEELKKELITYQTEELYKEIDRIRTETKKSREKTGEARKPSSTEEKKVSMSGLVEKIEHDNIKRYYVEYYKEKEVPAGAVGKIEEEIGKINSHHKSINETLGQLEKTYSAIKERGFHSEYLSVGTDNSPPNEGLKKLNNKMKELTKKIRGES